MNLQPKDFASASPSGTKLVPSYEHEGNQRTERNLEGKAQHAIRRAHLAL